MAARPATKQAQMADQPPRSRTRSAPRQSLLAVILAGLCVFFLYNAVGRMLLGLLTVALLIGIQMLIWRSEAIAFFRVIGVELLLALLIGWIWLMVHNQKAED